MYVFIFLVKVTEWPPIGKIAAHSAYDMFHGIKYLIVSLVFSNLGFWSGNLFLIAPFPDLCLLVPFDTRNQSKFTVQNPIRSITYPANNGDKTVQQQTAPPTRLVLTFPIDSE